MITIETGRRTWRFSQEFTLSGAEILRSRAGKAYRRVDGVLVTPAGQRLAITLQPALAKRRAPVKNPPRPQPPASRITAAQVADAAASCPRLKGSNLVAISDVVLALGGDAETIKRQLVELGMQRLVRLGRCDLPRLMGDKMQPSESQWGDDVVHMVRVTD